MTVETEKTFRISFKTEELKLIEEALTQLYIQVENVWNFGKQNPEMPRSKVHAKKQLTEKMLFNFRLFLAGNKKTGRRRAFRPWIEEHRQVLKEMV